MAYAVKITNENVSASVWYQVILPSQTGFRDLHRVMEILWDTEGSSDHYFTTPWSMLDVVAHGGMTRHIYVYEDKAVARDFLETCGWMRYRCMLHREIYQFKIELMDLRCEKEENRAEIFKARGSHNLEELNQLSEVLEKEEISMIENDQDTENKLSELKSRMEIRERGVENVHKWNDIKMEYEKSHNKKVRLVPEERTPQVAEQEPDKPDVRSEKIAQWLDLTDEFLEADIEVTVSIEPPKGTVEEALTEYDNKMLDMFCGDHLLNDAALSMNRTQKAAALASFWKEHPRYLFYILTFAEWRSLNELLQKPMHCKFRISHGDGTNAVIHGLTLGLLDIEITGKGKNRTVVLRFCEDATAYLNALPESEIDHIVHETRSAEDKVECLLNVYGMEKMDTLVETVMKQGDFLPNETEAVIFLLWHMCYRCWNSRVNREQELYLAAPQNKEIEILLNDRKRYGADQIARAQIPEDKQFADIAELLNRYPKWNKMAQFLEKNCPGANEEHVKECLAPIWIQIAAGRDCMHFG